MNKAVLAVGAILVVGAVGAGAFFLGKSSGATKPAPEAAKPVATAAPVQALAAPVPPAAAPPPPPRPVEDAAKPPGWPIFSIELASFRDLARAQEYLSVMQQRKLQPELVETVDAGGRVWYHVRVGKFDDPRQAAARLADVDGAAGIFGIVTTEIPVSQAQGK